MVEIPKWTAFLRTRYFAAWLVGVLLAVPCLWGLDHWLTRREERLCRSVGLQLVEPGPLEWALDDRTFCRGRGEFAEVAKRNGRVWISRWESCRCR